MTDTTTKVFASVGVIAVMVLTALLRCFVLSALWNWYLVPLLHAPHLTWGFAFGLSVIVGALHSPMPRKDDDRGFGERVAFVIIANVYGYSIGWLGTWFLP